jgi:hypothetical protein
MTEMNVEKYLKKNMVKIPSKIEGNEQYEDLFKQLSTLYLKLSKERHLIEEAQLRINEQMAQLDKEREELVVNSDTKKRGKKKGARKINKKTEPKKSNVKIDLSDSSDDE